MSTTIAMAFEDEISELLLSKLREIAHRYGYSLIYGLNSAETDVLKGIQQATETLNWKTHLFIKAPMQCKGTLAFGIQEELCCLETEGKVPSFFGFLGQLNCELKPLNVACWFIFAGEWYEDESVQFLEGTFDELVNYLKRPGNWYQRLFVVSTGHFQDSDELPLIFKCQ